MLDSSKRGVLWYTLGEANITIRWPENYVSCRYCRFMRQDAGGARYRCCLTDEILTDINNVGHECPADFDHLCDTKED